MSAEVDRHRIYTAASITSLFLYLLCMLRRKVFLQYTYLIQLITDANGILVLLKFLTDKFQTLSLLAPSLYNNPPENFLLKLKSTIYNVLQLLFATCNNFPQKIKGFLFDYNSYTILKKIPTLFEEDPTLSELAYDLLRIQFPFFTKKMKESAANMKMITDVYCKCPKPVPAPAKKTLYQKLLLLNKGNNCKNIYKIWFLVRPKKPKQILNVEDVKNVHMEFNNHNYWHVEAPPTPIHLSYEQRLWSEVQIDKDFNYEEWLEQNVWSYYE